jgi:hypothetical protein
MAAADKSVSALLEPDSIFVKQRPSHPARSRKRLSDCAVHQGQLELPKVPIALLPVDQPCGLGVDYRLAWLSRDRARHPLFLRRHRQREAGTTSTELRSTVLAVALSFVVLIPIEHRLWAAYQRTKG